MHAALHARAYDAAVAEVRDNWFTLVSGPVHELAPVLEAQPPGELEQHPLLSALLGHAQASVVARRPLGLRRLAEAAAAASASSSSVLPIDRALILVGQADLHRTLGRMEASLAAAKAASAALATAAPAAGEARWYEDAYGRLGMSLLSVGERQWARSAFEEAVVVAETSGVAPSALLLAALAIVDVADGDLMAARMLADRVRESGPPTGSLTATVLETTEAALALEDVDRAGAAEWARRPFADPDGSLLWAAGALVHAMMLWLGGHPGRALASLDDAVRLHGQEGRANAVRGMVAPTRAVLQLALGRPDAASAILDRDTSSVVDRHLVRARIELALGRHGAALKQARSAVATAVSTREHVEAYALEAAALLRFSAGPRVEAVVDHLGASLAGSGLRLPLRLLPASDLARVGTALTSAGYREALALDGVSSLLPELSENLLTPRETAALAALLENSSHAAIAVQLNVSVNTVKSQLRSVYRKLGVSTREDAIAMALDRHLWVQRE